MNTYTYDALHNRTDQGAAYGAGGNAYRQTAFAGYATPARVRRAARPRKVTGNLDSGQSASYSVAVTSLQKEAVAKTGTGWLAGPNPRHWRGSPRPLFRVFRHSLHT